MSVYLEVKKLYAWPLDDCGLLIRNRATCTLTKHNWRRFKPLVSYQVDMNPLPPISIPDHLAELLPSEQAMQEMDLVIDGGSELLKMLAQEAHERSQRTPEQVAADERAAAEAEANAPEVPFGRAHGKTGYLLWKMEHDKLEAEKENASKGI